MSKPSVTVLIDTYNHERFIEKAIVSAFDQEFPIETMEILVVDDGSTDQTPEIVRKFEPRLRLIRKPNGGQASAFNVGIAEAQGEIVAFLDGDDWWAPNKLKEVTDAFEKNPGIGVVGHGYYEIDPDAGKMEGIVPERTFRVARLDQPAGVLSLLSSWTFLATSRLAIRKEVLDRILPVPEELKFAVDGFLFVTAVAIADAIVLNDPLCYYRVHSENLWATEDPDRLRRRQEMQDCLFEKVQARLSSFGVPLEVQNTLLEPMRLNSERSRLSCDGGSPWRTFQAERASYRSDYRDASFGYKVFKALILGLTLVMSPRRFYKLKQWYAQKGLRQLREKLGNPVPADHVRALRNPVVDLAAALSRNVTHNGKKT